jgi:hypothetical protein
VPPPVARVVAPSRQSDWQFLTVWDEVDELVDRTDEITRDDLHKMRLRR